MNHRRRIMFVIGVGVVLWAILLLPLAIVLTLIGVGPLWLVSIGLFVLGVLVGAFGPYWVLDHSKRARDWINQ